MELNRNMAKARDIPGLDAGMPFTEAAAATVAVRAEEMFEQAENVLDITDIERVHDMRVASRRLRAVLEIYAPCFPADEFRPILREVKALADALGARRDPDVLLDQLAKLEGTLPKADAPGVEAFAAPVHDEQARGNEILAAALDHAERTDLRGRLALLASRAAAPEEPEAPEPAEPEAVDEVAVAAESAPTEPETAGALEAVVAGVTEPEAPAPPGHEATTNGDGPTPYGATP
jgi:inorganic triphosphatase YgiF